jgi:hypothetical protein
MTKSQSGDGYKCSCGYITDDRMKFVHHIGHVGKKEGRENHQSLGRVDLTTGELTMPPYLQRTAEQKAESSFGKRVQKIEADGKIVTVRQPTSNSVRTTDILSQATEVRFVPRIFTTTYTPIMAQAFDAAVKYFGWRPNMPFENFLDTTIYLFFREHGIRLGEYNVDDSLVPVSRAVPNPVSTDQNDEDDDKAKEDTKEDTKKEFDMVDEN